MLSVLIFSCSSNKQVNDESPYSDQGSEFIYNRGRCKETSGKFDVNSYIIVEEGDDGTWYRIISGAKNSLDKYKMIKIG